jgi:hypothetical protein
MSFTSTTDIGGVHHGPGAMTAILWAFIQAKGAFEVQVSIGIEIGRSNKTQVLVMIGETKAIFTPDELREGAERIIEKLPDARRFGASERDVADLRGLAEVLIRNADTAATVSPHGLH